MALKVEFKGFVQEIKTFDWGNVIVVAHDQRQMNNGTWETVGRDYINVTFEGETPLKDALVDVKGNLKISTYPKKDGTMGIDLKVRAESITPVSKRQSDPLPF
jgi:hypothetical protein